MSDERPERSAPRAERPAATGCAAPSPDSVCPGCGSEDLASIKAKLVCRRCRAIVLTCCES